MQPKDLAHGGEGGEREKRNGNVQYSNAVLTERTDSVVYGYLLRMGYNDAAACMDRESPFLGSYLARSQVDNRTVVTVNDRVHDHNLEQIIELFCQEGQFGVNQNLLNFGEELRQLTNKYTSLTTANAPGRSHIHQQIYGRPAYSRNQQIRNYTLRPSPQARAQMELQQIAQIGETRYREEQQAAHLKQMEMQIQQRNLQREEQETTAPSHTAPLPQPREQQIQQQQNNFNDAELAHPSHMVEGSSRRKLHQPQNYIAKMMDTVIDPLVGMINDRPWSELDNLNIDNNQFFENFDELDKNFLAMYDYEQPNGGGDQVYDEIIVSPIYVPNEQQEQPANLQSNSADMPVEEEIVLQANEARQVYVIPNPSPLLSPLSMNLNFGIQAEQPPQPQERAPKVIEDPKPTKRPDPPKKSDQIPESKGRVESDVREKEKERKDRRSVERSSRNDSPRRTSDDSKRRDEKKKHHRDKEREKEREKSTNRERENHPDGHEHSASSTRHSSKHKHKVQSDRESTPSSSSRAPPFSDASDSSSKRDGDKRRKEKDREEKKKSDISEKEKQRSKLPPSISSNNNKKLGDDMLQKMKEASTSKRKADEMMSTKKDFRIPKKSSSSSTSSKPEMKAVYGAHLQSGPLIRESVSPSTSSSSSKRERERAFLSAEIVDGEGRPDTTHFIQPRAHVARLSSSFVNSDKGYEAFQKGLDRKNKGSQEFNEDAISDISVSPPPEGHPASSSSSRPSRPMIAPQKGFVMKKSSSDTPTTEVSSSEESGKETPEDDDDPFPQKKHSRRDSDSPEPKRPCREIDMEKANAMLDRLHGPNR